MLSKPSETSRQRQNPTGMLDSVKSKPGKRARGLSNPSTDSQTKRSRDEMFQSPSLDPSPIYENGTASSAIKLRGIHSSFPSLSTFVPGMTRNDSGSEDINSLKGRNDRLAIDLPQVQFASPHDLSISNPNSSIQLLPSPQSNLSGSRPPPIRRSNSSPSLSLPSTRLTNPTVEQYSPNTSTILSSHQGSNLPTGIPSNMFSSSRLFLQTEYQSNLTENLPSEIVQKIFKLKTLLSSMTWKIDHFSRKRDGTLVPHYNEKNPNHIIDEIQMLSGEIKEMIQRNSMIPFPSPIGHISLQQPPQSIQNLSQHSSSNVSVPSVLHELGAMPLVGTTAETGHETAASTNNVGPLNS